MLISHLGIMKVGSCSFRFEYLKSSVSPLQEANGTLATGKVQSKSPRTPKQIGKENSASKRASSGEVLTPLSSASRKITPKVVLNMSPSTTPSRRKSRSKDGTTPTAASLPATPVSAVSKREKVPTPIPSRNSSLYRRSSRKSSLASIQEVDEPANLTRKRSLSTSLLSGSLLNASVDNELPRKRSRKSVTFGPMLSPEFFDKRFPPSTPVKAGSGPSGKRRSVLSTSVLSEAIDEVSEEDLTDSSDDEYEYSLTGFEDSFLDGSNDEKNSPTEDSDEYFIAEEDPPPKRKLATPTKIEIECRPPLHKMQPALPSPVRQTFSSHPILTQTKRVVSSPLLNQARNSRLSLGKAKIGMSTPIRRDIEKRPSLRKTKKSMPTPVRKAIEDKPSLRKTKKSMPTPVRKAIEDKPSLHKTKKSMPVLLRKAIESNPTLHKTLKSMATPIRREIEAKPSLRKTRQSMPSPLLAEIRTRYSLRAAIKRSLPTPIRKTIESQPALRKTKRTMPTPLRVDIQGRPKLCKTKKSLPSTLRLAIEAKHTLRKTKRTLPTPIRDAIKQRPGLRTTKPSLPSSLATEIESKPALRVTKKKLPTPLRAQIKSGVALNATKKSLPTPVRGEIQGRPKLSHVPLRPVKRAVGESLSSCDSPVPLPPSKKRRVATSSPSPYKRLRPAKRAVGESLSNCDSPVPLPPAKRRRVAPSSPSPYKFDAFLKRGVSSPDLAGMRSIFNSPKVKFSAEPSDMFEPSLFGGAPTGISFASPLAYSAKKPNGPQRTVPMASRLKNKSESIRFEIGSSEPLSTARNGKKRIGRAKATARAPRKVTRSTRNSQVQLGEEVTVTLATRRSKRGTALKEAAPAVPLSGFTTGPSMATRRSRRGKEAVSIEDNPMVTPMATRRSRRGKEEEAAAISIEDTPMATRRSKRGTAAKKEAAGVSVDDTPMVTPLVTRRSRRGTDKEETANGKTKKTKVEEVLSTPISVRSNAAGSRRGKKTRGTVASEAVEVEVQSPRIHVTRSRKTTEKAEEKPAQQDAGVVGPVRRSHRLQKQ